MRPAAQSALRRVASLIGALAPAALAGCAAAPAHYRFRMTVEILTAQGPRTGSSVFEVTAATTVRLLPDEAARDWAVKGQAVAVALPGGQTVYAIMRTADRRDLARVSMTTLDPAFRNDIVESARRIGSGEARAADDVAPQDYPMFVRFADPGDPTTIEVLGQPDLRAGSTSYGRVTRVSLAVTEDPVSTGLREQLPYRTHSSRFAQWLAQLAYGDPRRLGPADFYRGNRP